MDTTSASLLERLRQPGDRAAWERFVRLYTPLLCLWADRLGRHGQDRDDLVQDVFLILLRELPRFRYRPDGSFRGWLKTVLLNKLREHRRRPAPADGEALDGLACPDPGDALDETEYRQYLVQRALELLRTEFEPATWQAFWEFVVRGRPGTEVARELGISENAVYLTKGRVLRLLRAELGGLLE